MYYISKAFRVFWRYTSVVITVSGWAGGESSIGPNGQCLWRVAGALHHWVLLCIDRPAYHFGGLVIATRRLAAD